MAYITYNLKIPSKKKPLWWDFGEWVDHVGRNGNQDVWFVKRPLNLT
jgi:hypothetical protein